MHRPIGTGACAVAFVMVISIAGGVEAGGPERHAGKLHSLSPAHGVLVIEEIGAKGQTELVEIQIRGAAVVRIWRDPSRPWEWLERPTTLARWAAGTFVVVIGQPDSLGVVNAHRVEIPSIGRD